MSSSYIMAASRAKSARNLISVFSGSACCPVHQGSGGLIRSRRGTAEINDSCKADYAYEISSSNFRFGPRVTQELAYDLETFGARKTMVLTDPFISKLGPFRTVLDTLTRHKTNFEVFDQVRVEPSDKSMIAAIDFSRKGNFDAFVAVGGGSTMDTAKMASIYAANPSADFWDFVTPPFGKDMNPKKPMMPLICIPTTAGTGSECTGISIFELTDNPAGAHVKTGVRKRQITPHLALVDPEHVLSMPRNVAIYSGFDVLCHALESFTLLPFNERSPLPQHPLDRPITQGRNPFSDAWAREGLRLLSQNFREAIKNPENVEAKYNMLLASSIAGMGFGNAGVHLCHGLSYAISGAVKTHQPEGYPKDHPIIPHGLSVCLTAPADFEFTGPACPDQHLEAAQLLNVDIRNSKQADAGKILADTVRGFMRDLDVPNGLKEVGFEQRTSGMLANGAMASLAARKLCPRTTTQDEIEQLYENSWTIY